MRRLGPLLVVGVSAFAASFPRAAGAPKTPGHPPAAPEMRPITLLRNSDSAPGPTGKGLREQPGLRRLLSFEDAPVDRLPEGWRQGWTGEGGTDWRVLPTSGGRVLAQTRSDNPNAHFNVAWLETLTLKNLKATVRFRAISGEHDQGGGLIWRARDERNHYVVRANPLENNVVLYKTEDGRRTDLPLLEQGRTYGVKVPALDLNWHTLGIEVREDAFTVSLDAVELFRVQDTTFSGAGHVGLWTKADAVTWFDDLLIVELPSTHSFERGSLGSAVGE